MTASPSGPSRERARVLLDWFDRVKRPLPWRASTDPYRIWVSEIMLQQTRVETVLSYYDSFLSRFPTVEDLAKASDDQVRSSWSGLGYYRRAILLRDAARLVVERGRLPSTRDEWLALPGVGRYTAAAIASIACGERVVALDGNLERVLSRIEAFEGNPKTAAGRRILEAAAGDWLDPTRPGDSNQALMELGASLCRPRRPRCPDCPVARFCEALRAGIEETVPARPIRRTPVEREILTVVVTRGDRFLVFRRSSRETLLAGTWELPWVELGNASPESALSGRYGGSWLVGPERGRLRHSITHRRLNVSVRRGEIRLDGEIADGPRARWTDLAGLEQLAHSSLVRKAVLVGLGLD